MSQETLQEKSRPINPGKLSCGDPVMDVYAVRDSLSLLAQSYRLTERLGDANVIELLARQLDEALDDLDGMEGVQ